MIRVQVLGDKLDLAEELQEEFVSVASAVVSEGADIYLHEVTRLLELRSGPEPSPGGEPPAKQSGALHDSWKKLRVRASGRVVSSGIQSRDPGAYAVEFGEVANTAEKVGRQLRFEARTAKVLEGRRPTLRRRELAAIRERAAALATDTVRRLPRPYLGPAQATVEPKITALFLEKLK